VVPLITQKCVFAIWGLCWYNFVLFWSSQSFATCGQQRKKP